MLNECGTGIFCLWKKFLCLFFFKKLKKRRGICIMDTEGKTGGREELP